MFWEKPLRSKALGEFQRANLIEIKDRSLTIRNPAELRRVADRSSVNVHFSRSSRRLG
jgi:hypothetical protein